MLIVHLFVCFVRVNFRHFFSSSWCRGLTAVCDCGTSWTFLLTFVYNYQSRIYLAICQYSSIRCQHHVSSCQVLYVCFSVCSVESVYFKSVPSMYMGLKLTLQNNKT